MIYYGKEAPKNDATKTIPTFWLVGDQVVAGPPKRSNTFHHAETEHKGGVDIKAPNGKSYNIAADQMTFTWYGDDKDKGIFVIQASPEIVHDFGLSDDDIGEQGSAAILGELDYTELSAIPKLPRSDGEPSNLRAGLILLETPMNIMEIEKDLEACRAAGQIAVWTVAGPHI